MTIYQELLRLGYTPEDMNKAAEQTARKSNPRQFGLVVADQPDGDPVVGVSYTNDYRAEEEWGVGSLARALFGQDKHNHKMIKGARNHVGKIIDVPETTLVLSVQGYADLDRIEMHHFKDGDYGIRQTDYAEWYTENLPRAKGVSSSWEYTYKKMDKLREIATEMGIEKPQRTKDALIQQIVAAKPQKTPDLWPGWFHFGNVLILRAGGGIVADTLKLLYKAGRETETLGIGGGSFGPFASGLTLFDTADLSKTYIKERNAHEKWVRKQEKALQPVLKKMKEDGYTPLFLGNPKKGFKSLSTGSGGRPVDPDTTYYWLNGSTWAIPELNGKRVQPFGWYTLDELRDRKFLHDAAEREKSRS